LVSRSIYTLFTPKLPLMVSKRKRWGLQVGQGGNWRRENSMGYATMVGARLGETN
jgi:hypothetical protein